MIFVTVGSDLPFDRLVRVVDRWAADAGRTEVFAQIGQTSWRPSHVAFQKFLEPAEFAKCIASATVVISHAGMGTILSALRAGKPVLVMPRLHALREVRNEHQLATCRRLAAMGMVDVALDEGELLDKLSRLDELRPRRQIGRFASDELLNALREFTAQAASK